MWPRSILSKCVWSRCQISTATIQQHFAVFSCIIARQMLFSPSFQRENAVMGMPHFHGKNPTKFHVWCTMAHQQGFVTLYMVLIDMLILWWAEALQSVKHVNACRIHRETNITWWHGSRQSHRDDHAHSIAWICIYGNRLEHIPILEGQELSWLDKITHIATRVHHTKCTITHTHVGIYIYMCVYINSYIHHAQCYYTEWKSKLNIANVQRVWPNKVQEM